MLRVTPARSGGVTGRRIAQELGAVTVNPNREPRSDAEIVNWGRTRFARNDYNFLMNRPDRVAQATNKLVALTIMPEEICVPWTSDMNTVRHWLNQGDKVMVRETLTGRAGRGIRFVETVEQFEGLVPAQLYTKYLGRRTEYRVHVIGQNVMTVQKKLRNGTERNENTFRIRSHENGWIHARNDISSPHGLENAAQRAISSLGLDFGAVDLVNSDRFGLRVLEVNTAPGLEASALEFYVAALQGELDALRS